MTVGLVLSGGGARGSFEMGAVKCLYVHFGVRPDVIIGTSVGAINAAKLAEARTREQQLAAMRGLEAIWRSLMRNSNMYVEADWLRQFSPSTRSTLQGLMRDPSALHIVTAVLSVLINPIPLSAEVVQAFQSLLKSHSSIYELKPIEDRLRGINGQNKELNRDTVREGIAQLRLAIVSLESGVLRYVTNDGRLLERDLQTSALPNP